jgi:hypothetical protein
MRRAHGLLQSARSSGLLPVYRAVEWLRGGSAARAQLLERERPDQLASEPTLFVPDQLA